jgi:hypothetical protein
MGVSWTIFRFDFWKELEHVWVQMKFSPEVSTKSLFRLFQLVFFFISKRWQGMP